MLWVPSTKEFHLMDPGGEPFMLWHPSPGTSSFLRLDWLNHQDLAGTGSLQDSFIVCELLAGLFLHFFLKNEVLAAL